MPFESVSTLPADVVRTFTVDGVSSSNEPRLPRPRPDAAVASGAGTLPDTAVARPFVTDEVPPPTAVARLFWIPPMLGKSDAAVGFASAFLELPPPHAVTSTPAASRP